MTAATDAIGTYHFNDSLSKSAVPSRDCTPRALPRAQGATSAVGLLAMARQEAFRILPYSFFSLQDSFISVPRPYSELPGKAQKKLRSFDRSFMLALPIFPCSHPQSIVGANELNFCVRDGNRWTLMTINTNYADGFSPSLCQMTFVI